MCSFAPARLSRLPSNCFTPLGAQIFSTRLAALRGSERRECLSVDVFAFCGLENVSYRLLKDAERILREVRSLAASTCSTRHGRSMA
jgi:hypothetical protein